MKNWSPVEGLREITSNQLRKGDKIILRSKDEKSYSELIVDDPGAWPSDMREKMWLLDRPYTWGQKL